MASILLDTGSVYLVLLFVHSPPDSEWQVVQSRGMVFMVGRLERQVQVVG